MPTTVGVETVVPDRIWGNDTVMDAMARQAARAIHAKYPDAQVTKRDDRYCTDGHTDDEPVAHVQVEGPMKPHWHVIQYAEVA